MDWYRNLYIGEGIKHKAKKAMDRIEKGKAAPGVYLITLASNPDNILEIIAASYLMQKALQNYCPKVVGIARGKEEALEVMQQIIKDTYENTGNFRVEKYIQDR